MAGRFLGLKLTFLRRRALSLRRDRTRTRAGVVMVAVVAWLAFAYGPGIWDVLTSTGELADAEGFLAMQSFSLVFTWVAAVFSFAGRRDLDVRRFQLLPLGRWQLARGLASTWLLSPGVYLTAGVIGVVIASFPEPGARLVLMAAGGLVLVVLCAVAGQLTSTGTDLLARRRRARDLLLLVSMFISLVPVLLVLEMSQQFEDQGANSTIGDVVGWIPIAWPGRVIGAAAAGDTAEAAGFLAGSLVLVGLCVWGWASILGRSLLAEDASSQRRVSHRDPFASFDRRLPAGRRGASAALELRLLWREPGRLPSTILVTVLLGGMFTALAAVAFAGADTHLAAFGVIGLPIIVMFRRVNEYGMSSSARWMSAVAGGRSSDDLWGRDLANALIDVPLVVAVALGLAGVSGGWLFVVPAVLAGLAAVLAVYAAMHLVSIRMAKGQPAGKDTEGVTQAKQDPLLSLAGMFATLVVLAPLAATLGVAANGPTAVLVLVVPVVVAYGVGLWWWSLRSVGGWLDANEADLLDAIAV